MSNSYFDRLKFYKKNIRMFIYPWFILINNLSFYNKTTDKTQIILNLASLKF